MVTQDHDLQLLLDLLGVFVFALSGGLVAVRKGLDLVGVLVLAWVAGLGGGMMRDVFLGDVPPVGLTDWRQVTSAAVAGLGVFGWYRRIRSVIPLRTHTRAKLIGRSVRVLDAGGLALFAVSGSVKALEFGAGALAAIILGVITATGGGALRDVLAGQVPEVLRRELYAVPALVGATLIVVAHGAGFLNPIVIWGAVALVFVIRITAVVLDLNAPTALRTTGDTP